MTMDRQRLVQQPQLTNRALKGKDSAPAAQPLKDRHMPASSVPSRGESAPHPSWRRQGSGDRLRASENSKKATNRLKYQHAIHPM